MKRRFGEVLLDRGLITPKQLLQALELQQRRGLRLGTALVSLGALSEDKLVEVLGSELGFEVIDLAIVTPREDALALVSASVAREHDLLPLELRAGDDGRRLLFVAMADPTNTRLIDELRFLADVYVIPVLATGSSIRERIDVAYGPSGRGPAPPGEARPEPVIELSPEIEVVVGRPSSIPGSGPLVHELAVRPLGAEPFAADPSGGLPFAMAEDSYANPRELDPSRAAIVRTESGGYATNPSTLQDYYGHGLLDAEGGVLQADEVRALERKFWALLRVLVKKGVISKQELLEELERTKK